MNCTEAHDLLHAMADDELRPDERAQVTRHAEGCPHCTRTLAEARLVKNQVRAVGRFAAPEQLERRVRAAIAIAPREPEKRRWTRPFGLGAASGAALMAASFAAALWLGPAATPQGELADYVSAYVRVQRSPFEQGILSNDPHTVKPWISGRSDLSPRVAELTDDGFPLLGARIEHIAGHDAVAVVYGRRKHRISLFVQVADGAGLHRIAGNRRGFNAISWQDGDLLYVAVSDIAEAELGEFAQLFRQRTAGPRSVQ